MKRVEKVAISVPKDVYDWVEQERAKRQTTRSQLVTSLLRGEMYRQELEQRAKRYEEAYRKYPETEEEADWFALADQAFDELLAKDEQET
jgi:metal-responsive CopG/Arc/MetJ family transcriptional regulator